jgi:PAS domain S-box-containing protein
VLFWIRRLWSGKLSRPAVIVLVMAWALEVSIVLHFGASGSIMAAVPVALTGALWGPQAGALAGLASYLVPLVGAWLDPARALPFSAYSIMETLAVIVVGSAVGVGIRQRDRAERLLADTFTFAPAGMALLGITGMIERVNPALCRITGLDEQALLRMRWCDLVCDDAEQDVAEGIARLVSGNEESRIVQCRLRGTELRKHTSVHMSVVRKPRDKPILVLVQVIDETELIESNQALRELINTKDRFLASVSHELRTPLAAAMGLACEMRDRASEMSATELAEFAAIIAQETTDLGALIDDMLLVARSTRALDRIEHGAIDLHFEAARTVETFLLPAQIKVAAPTVGDGVYALGDSRKVRQILRNLLENAHNYGGPNVSVEIGAKGREATVTVIDDGDGIDPSAVDSVFEPYRRFHERPGLTESLGIGLHVSREIARLIGGDLTYERDSGNTRFTLTLPSAVTPEQRGHEAVLISEVDLLAAAAHPDAERWYAVA